IVNGNAGQDAGRGMIGGNLVVKGNASSVGEDMIGGSITVEGECLWSAGCCMRNGTISVMGNTVSVGRDMEGGVIATGSNIEGFSGMGMAGGVITINGGAGGNGGEDMIDGLIVVKGDAGKELACGMLGGETAIDGDCPGLGSAIRGRILQKGETIFDTALRRLGQDELHGIVEEILGDLPSAKSPNFRYHSHSSYSSHKYFDEDELRATYRNVSVRAAPLLLSDYSSKDVEWASLALAQFEHDEWFMPM